MLSDSKKIFKSQADTIEGWEQMTKQQLADLYVENENNKRIADACFCALAVKSWNLIGSNYIKNPKITSPEDCYDILMDSIKYSLDKRRWLHEDSNIYQDPNGFDKALNRRMKSLRLNKYVETMRQKNRLNYLNKSVDDIVDNYGDIFFSDEEIKIDPVEDFADNIIIDSFNTKKYFKSFLFDIIANGDVFNITNNGELEFSYKKTCKNLRNIDSSYCEYFSCRYDLPKDKVEEASKVVGKQDTDKMELMIDREFRQYRHDKLMKSLKEPEC